MIRAKPALLGRFSLAISQSNNEPRKTNSMRTTKAELRQTVKVLQNRGYNIAINWAYGQPRLCTKDESRDIGPRLQMGQMKLFLDGILWGIDLEGI